MKNFIRQHVKRILFILIVLIINSSLILIGFNFKYIKSEKENTHRVIVVTYNPLTGAIVPIEYFYYESKITDKTIYFKGISDLGKVITIELFKEYIIMFSTEEINTQLKEISKE